MAGSITKFVERMKYWCETANLGYSQGAARNNIYQGGTADCSSLVVFTLKEAGFTTGTATSTSDMRSALVANGWKVVTNNGAPQIGDILLRDGVHVAAYVGNGKLAEAVYNENGGLTGGQPGDQTGQETRVTNYYNSPWSCYLRWSGSNDTSNNNQNTANKGEIEMIMYKVNDSGSQMNGAIWLFNGEQLTRLNGVAATKLGRNITTVDINQAEISTLKNIGIRTVGEFKY